MSITAIKKEVIAVLYGGNSAEREVSLNSGKAVAKGLEQAGFNVVLMDTKETPLSELVVQKIKRVFIALHGKDGESGELQSVLEQKGIPYSGSDSVACKNTEILWF